MQATAELTRPKRQIADDGGGGGGGMIGKGVVRTEGSWDISISVSRLIKYVQILKDGPFPIARLTWQRIQFTRKFFTGMLNPGVIGWQAAAALMQLNRNTVTAP